MHEWIKSKYNLNDPNVLSAIDDLPLWSAPFGLKLLDVVELKQNINVLDIGSGTGFPIIELSQRLGNTCKVYGIDPWEAAVDRIKFKMKIWDIKNLKIINGNVESLPFEDKHFDLIISNNGINNVEDDKKALEEISRVSKSGAQFVVTMNLPETMIEFYDIFRSVLKENNKTMELRKLEDHIFSKRKPLSYTTELLVKSGFKIQGIHKDSFNLRFTDASSMLNHFFIKLSFLESWKIILNAQDVKRIFKRIENKLNMVSQQNGELKLTIPWVCMDCRKL